jgi:hypothetical protein
MTYAELSAILSGSRALADDAVNSFVRAFSLIRFGYFDSAFGDLMLAELRADQAMLLDRIWRETDSTDAP